MKSFFKISFIKEIQLFFVNLQAYKFVSLQVILLFFLTFSFVKLQGQAINNQIGDVVMPSANAASLGKYGDIPVSYHTGVPNIDIPIHTLQEGPLSIPISLSYHAGGVKVGEPSSCVGLNWSLQAGGMISRSIQGRPDESSYGFLQMNQNLNIYGVGHTSSYVTPSPNYTSPIDIATGLKDGEPDIFSFSVGKYSGKFFFGANDSVVVVPKQDVSIQYTLAANQLTKFTIRTPDGVIYEFGDSGDGSPAIETTMNYSSSFTSFWIASGWHLKRISTPDLTSYINFTYTAEEYRLYSKPSAGLVYSKVQNSDTIPAKSLYQPTNYSQIRSWRLNTIKTTTETVTFVPSSANRQDVTNPIVGSESKSLNKIKIDNGSYCKNFILSQSYFQDTTSLNANGYDADYRLKLNNIQEQSCDGTTTQPQYLFNYYGDTANPNYLPNRYSKAVDHWGYYNGANENVKYGMNIPFTRFRYKDAQGVFHDVSNGGANRETNEELMKWGTLQKITYPTGGSTAFEFEANTYWDTLGQKAMIKIDSLSRYWPVGQCYTDNSSYTLPTISRKFTADELDNMFYEGYNIKSTIPASAGGNCGTSSFYTNISVYQGSSTTPIYVKSVSGSDKLIYLFPTLQPDVQYRFEMSGSNSAAIFYFLKQVTINPAINRKVGGLRVKKITTSDGINTANDIVKTYDYSRDSTTVSSGLLYNQPKYGALYDDYIECGNGNCGAIGIYASPKGYRIPVFTDYAIVPLGGFEGKTVGYSTVKEINRNGSYTKYTYFQEPVGDYYQNTNGSPTLPPQPNIEAGNICAQYQVDNMKQTVSSMKNTIYTDDSYANSSGACFKVNFLRVFQTDLFALTTSYSIRNKSYRLSKVESMSDNIVTTTTYGYDPQTRFYAPTDVTTINSDGSKQIIKTYYAYNLPTTHPNYNNNSFASQFMIGIPLQQDVYYNGVKRGGSVLEYKTYGSGLYPYRSYSINRDSTLKLNVTVNAYDRGLPQQMTKANFLYPQIYSWDTYKRLTAKNYGTLNWSFAYDGNSTLVNQTTDENGLVKKFTYDRLMRLSKIQDRMKPDGTDIQATTYYSYQYKDVNTNNPYNYVGTITTFANASNSTPLSTKQYIDGLGRPMEVVKEYYTPSNLHQKNYMTYDSLGRQYRSFLPFESSAWGLEAATNQYTQTDYELSPLSRPTKQTNVDGTIVQTSYGTNNDTDVRICKATSEGVIDCSLFYDAGSLYQTTMTNENGKQTVVFKDKLGRVILTRKYLGSTRVETYNVYDDYGQLVAVLPPGSVAANGNVTYSLAFQYTYDNQNRLIQKHIPGADAQKFFYDNRDLLTLTQDGNMRAVNSNKYLATQYNSLGRVLKTGWKYDTTGLWSGVITIANDTNKLTETQYYPGKSWVKHQGAKVLKPWGTVTNRDFVWSYIE